MNNAAVDMAAQTLGDSAFSPSGGYPQVELLDLVVILFNFFEDSLYCFPQRLCHFTFPPPVNKGPHFSTSSPALVVFRFCFLESSQWSGYEEAWAFERSGGVGGRQLHGTRCRFVGRLDVGNTVSLLMRFSLRTECKSSVRRWEWRAMS